MICKGPLGFGSVWGEGKGELYYSKGVKKQEAVTDLGGSGEAESATALGWTSLWGLQTRMPGGAR